MVDAATGETTATLEGDHVSRVAFGPDGRWLAVASCSCNQSDYGLAIWEAPGWTLRKRLLEGPVNDLAVAPDGSTIAAGTPKGVVLVDAETLAVRRLRRSDVFGIAFSPDGKVVAAGDSQGSLTLVDAASATVVRSAKALQFGSIEAAAFSPDGTRLAIAGTDGSARLLDTQTLAQVARFRGHVCCVLSVAFSPDGRRLATGSLDYTAKVWDVTGTELRTLDAGSARVLGVAFSHDGTLLASGEDEDTARVWAAATGSALLTLRHEPGPREVGPEGGFVAHVPACVRDTAFSADDRLLATACADGKVRLWSVSDGKLVRTIDGLGGPVGGIAFSPDGSALAAGLSVGATRVFDVATGRSLDADVTSSAEVVAVAYSPDGSLLAVGDGRGGIQVARAATGAPVADLEGPDNPVNAVAFSPDGQLLAVGYASDVAVHVWDVARREEIRTLVGHTADVTALAFRPDGSMIASASVDGTVRIWDTATGRPLRLIAAGVPVWDVATGGEDGSVRVWDACTACRSPDFLLQIAVRRVTRELSPAERATFLGEQGSRDGPSTGEGPATGARAAVDAILALTRLRPHDGRDDVRGRRLGGETVHARRAPARRAVPAARVRRKRRDLDRRRLQRAPAVVHLPRGARQRSVLPRDEPADRPGGDRGVPVDRRLPRPAVPGADGRAGTGHRADVERTELGQQVSCLEGEGPREPIVLCITSFGFPTRMSDGKGFSVTAGEVTQTVAPAELEPPVPLPGG